jgi:hypothetical protein
LDFASIEFLRLWDELSLQSLSLATKKLCKLTRYDPDDDKKFLSLWFRQSAAGVICSAGVIYTVQTIY